MNCYNFSVLLGLEVLGGLGWRVVDDDDAEAGALGVERRDSDVVHFMFRVVGLFLREIAFLSLHKKYFNFLYSDRILKADLLWRSHLMDLLN